MLLSWRPTTHQFMPENQKSPKTSHPLPSSNISLQTVASSSVSPRFLPTTATTLIQVIIIPPVDKCKCPQGHHPLLSTSQHSTNKWTLPRLFLLLWICFLYFSPGLFLLILQVLVQKEYSFSRKPLQILKLGSLPQHLKFFIYCIIIMSQIIIYIIVCLTLTLSLDSKGEN